VDPITANAVYVTIKRLATLAQLDPAAVSPHALRHTFATLLVSAGVDIVHVQRVLSHSTLTMTCATWRTTLTISIRRCGSSSSEEQRRPRL
jgi:site-specific recombinase XerD